MSEARLPCVEGLFSEAGGGRVLGSRCANCGTPYFPRTAACHNPHCTDSRIEDCGFGGRGTLWSYSVADFQPPPPHRTDLPFRPYVIGVVDLDQGLRLVGQMVEGFEAMSIGAAVELVIDTLYHEGGAARTSWKFRLVDRASGAAP